MPVVDTDEFFLTICIENLGTMHIRKPSDHMPIDAECVLSPGVVRVKCSGKQDTQAVVFGLIIKGNCKVNSFGE